MTTSGQPSDGRAWERLVKVYGVQRSGTNLVKFLLESNFRGTLAIDLPLGNKHERPRPHAAFAEWCAADEHPVAVDRLPYTPDDIATALRRNQVGAVAVVKPLLPWLVSFFRYRRLKEPERYPALTPRMAQQWTRRWLETNGAFAAELRALGWRHVILDYRRLLDDLPSALGELQHRLGLTPAGPSWVEADRVMKRSTDEMHGGEVVSDRPFDASYYTDRSYLAELPDGVLAAVRQELHEHRPPPVLRDHLDPEVAEVAAPSGGAG